MTAKGTIARLRDRIAALVAARSPVDVVVWRHPGETEDQAIERYMRQHPEIAARTIHVVSWELLEK
jgi:predicted RNA-binding protein with PIN domain